jgi:hypothetical protein
MIKYHQKGSVLFITFSVEEGLLFQANPLCTAIIQSCLVAASKLYPIKISHMTAEATHFHSMITVLDPDHVQAFIRHFKTESAHAINAILGRKKRTVWCDGYDSPRVLTLSKAIALISYTYCNPAKDNLVSSIEEYPGFSTWQMFRSGETTKRWKRFRRPQYRCLPPESHNLRGYTKEAQRLLDGSSEIETFTLQPNAWMEAFGIRDPEQQKRINDRIVERVLTLEKRAAEKRIREKKTVIGRQRLEQQKIDTSYRPDRKGRKTCCLSDNRSLRIQYIKKLKGLRKEGQAIRAKWIMGDRTAVYPPGLYPPSFPKLANVVGC